MAEPDVRVDTSDLDAAGAELVRIGAGIAAATEGSSALEPDPAWSDGFASVAAAAWLGARWREELDRDAAGVTACGTAMRAAAAAWRETDETVAATLRTG